MNDERRNNVQLLQMESMRATKLQASEYGKLYIDLVCPVHCVQFTVLK